MKITLSPIYGVAKLALAGALLMAAVTGASAKDLRMASGVPPLHPAHNPLYTEFQKLLPEYSDGKLSGQLLGTEVTTVANMRASILSGLVEVGLFLPAYFPADLPNFNLVGDLSMMGSANPQATAAAMTEYILTCTDCQNEFKKLGLIYTNSHANPYSILATKPIIKPEDMNGIRLRTASPQHARWVEAMGGTAVSMPTGEAFEAISQRVVDGTVTSVSDVISFNLGDVITHITLLDLGTFHSLANHAVKDSVWKELSVSEREALMKASIVANVLTTARWVEMVEEGKGVARDKKLEILEPSAELIAKTEAFKAQDSADAAGRAQSRFGIEGAEEKIARFQALVEKWEGLIAEKGDSKDAIVALYESEILPKIDLEKYGQ